MSKLLESTHICKLYLSVAAVRLLLQSLRVRDARGTWHVLPSEGLQTFVQAIIGQRRGTADSKLAGHTCTYYPNMCAFVVAISVGCRLHAPGPENFFHVGSSGARKF